MARKPRKIAESTGKSEQNVRNAEDLSNDELKELIKNTSEEEKEGLRKWAKIQMVIMETSPRSFATCFELMQGSMLYPEQMKWVKNVFEAHKQGKGVLQECFRESGKSIVLTKYLFLYMVGKEPWKKSAFIRINDQKANETSKEVAEIIENDPLWKLLFPGVIPDKAKGWGAEGYNLKIDGMPPEQWARLIAGAPIGPTFVGYGYTSGSIIGSHWNGVVIVDDIEDENNTNSQRELMKLKKWYSSTYTYCVMDGAWEGWNFTPWLSNDLYADLKAAKTRLLYKTPALIRAEEGEEGATYWPEEPEVPVSGKWWKLTMPERKNFTGLSKVYREGGPIEFARMMMLDLEATKGVTLKAEWLHEYPGVEINHNWPVIMGVDYASTMDKLKDDRRDYFALAVYSAIPGGGIVLRDGKRAHFSKGEALDFMASYCALFPSIQQIGVETIGKGEEFYSDLVMLNDKNGRVLPLFPIPSHGRKSKGERFENWLAPRFRISRIWISDIMNEFLLAFKNEWLTYGAGNEHDDCLDAAYMGALAAEGFIPSQAERTGVYNNRQESISLLPTTVGLVGRRAHENYRRD